MDGLVDFLKSKYFISKSNPKLIHHAPFQITPTPRNDRKWKPASTATQYKEYERSAKAGKSYYIYKYLIYMCVLYMCVGGYIIHIF